jgi:hypothetical protein
LHGVDDRKSFLDNCYAEYHLAPRQRDEVVARYTNSYLPDGQPKDEIERDQIIPIVKDRAWLTEIQAGIQARGAQKLLTAGGNLQVLPALAR